MTDKSITQQDSINMSSISDQSLNNPYHHLFEQYVISAYKSANVEESYRALLSALNNIKSYIDLIKSQPIPITKPLLTKHMAERLKRISNRHFFHLTIQISKIYIALLNKDNFLHISLNSNLLIQISNDVIILLDIIKFTPLHKTLLNLNQEYLKYLLNKSDRLLSDDQRAIIDSLLFNLPSKYISHSYSNYSNKLKEMLIEKKNAETFNEFASYLSKMISLEEQYDLLKRTDSLYFLNNYLKADDKNINKDDCDLLFSIGKMLTLFIFNIKYTIKASNINFNDNDDSCKTYLLIDAHMKNVSKIQLNSFSNISFSFLNGSIYEISDEQKELMVNNKNILIYLIKLYILKVLNSFPNKFDILYVCFVLLKRVWYYFNDAFNDISDLFIQITDNILKITNVKHLFPSEMTEITDLLSYLSIAINNYNELLSNQIKERLSAITNSGPCDIKHPKEMSTSVTEVINIKDCNILIGYPLTFAIEPGAMHTQYFEITEENSLIYIYFTVNWKDISFSLLKYNPNSLMVEGTEIDDETDKGHFSKVLQLDSVKCSLVPIKLILFVQSPGVYKVIFDNSYSWITSKEIKCRITILRPLTSILSFENEAESIISNNKKKFNIFYNSIDYSLDIASINSKIKECSAEKEEMIIIPIIFYRNKLSIIVKDQSSTFIDPNNSALFSKQFLTETIESYLITNGIITNQSVFSVVLSFLSLNPNIAYKDYYDDEEKDSSHNHNMERNESLLTKDNIGDYIDDLMKKYPNRIQYYINRLNDIGLIYSIYNKEKENHEYETLIYFHIDSNIAQVSVYEDGMIYEEISGFDYDDKKSLIENIGLFAEVIKKTNESFENIKVEISYTNVDANIINDFIINLKKKMEKTKCSITVYTIILTHLHLFIN